MSKNTVKQIRRSFSREILLHFAASKALNYQSVTRRTPKTDQVIQDLLKKNSSYADELISILNLRRGLRLWTLTDSAKELKVYEDGLSKLALATRIYCANPRSLEELSRFNRTEPKRSTFGYLTEKKVTNEKLTNALKLLPEIIEENLSDPSKETIATLDDTSRVGENVRFVVTLDQKKRTVERPQHPKFPGRKGPHDDYPLKRVVGTYNRKSNVLRLSALKGVAERVVNSFSEALFGSSDGFVKENPNVAKVPLLFSDDALRKELADKGMRVIELELRQLPLEGSPSKLVMEGDNLVETINQLEKNDVKLIGPNLSQVTRVSIALDGRSVILDLIRGNIKEVGIFTQEEKRKIEEFLARWGIYKKMY